MRRCMTLSEHDGFQSPNFAVWKSTSLKPSVSEHHSIAGPWRSSRSSACRLGYDDGLPQYSSERSAEHIPPAVILVSLMAVERGRGAGLDVRLQRMEQWLAPSSNSIENAWTLRPSESKSCESFSVRIMSWSESASRAALLQLFSLKTVSWNACNVAEEPR